MEVSYISRPYKISNNGTQFKGIVAANLIDIKAKAIESLHLSGDEFDLFLAEDNTLVDNQEYFATIPENTKLIIKSVKDVVDGTTHEISESQELEHGHSTLLGGIKSKCADTDSSSCIVSLLRMTDEELDIISKSSWKAIQDEMGMQEELARVYVDSACKEMLRRKQLVDATNLLGMYHKTKENSRSVEIGKRKKVS